MPTQTTQPAQPPAADNPFEQFQWKPQPAAERLVRELVDGFLKRTPFAAMLRDCMYAEAGVRFLDLVDEITAPDGAALQGRLGDAGYLGRDDRGTSTAGAASTFIHPGGIFPLVKVVPSSAWPEVTVAIKVDSITDFVSVWQVPYEFESGEDDFSPLRLARIEDGDGAGIRLVERHGCRGYDDIAKTRPPAAQNVVSVCSGFRARPRRIGDHQGFESAIQLIARGIDLLGIDYTCDLFFAAERDYWQRRNWAGAVQKARQDRLGIGWANHDHHTYRSSRRHFARLISVFEKLGFHCRERFYAGRQAGWGAQVLEQPNAGVVIFADVDLSPDELLIDFAHEPLPERQQLGTVGLWCALHGESFLEAGMHHLECQFDFEALRTQLEAEAGIRTMKPFTDFPYLRQAFTEGERWPVREDRIRGLLERGQITPEQAEAFRTQGSIGSHLENLERNEGFKGFNQTGVSEIIAATDPRKQLSTKGAKAHER